MFERILVPMDGTVTAVDGLAAAMRLAARWSAHVDVLALLRTGDRMLMVDDIVQKQVSRLLDDHPDLCSDVEYNIRDMEYSVVDDIAMEAESVENTLVVMSTWARDRRASLISNIAEDVMRHLRRPVLFVGPKVRIDEAWPEGDGTRLIGVCTDGSEFADSVLPHAARWASGLGLGATVLSVVDPQAVPASVGVAAESNASANAASALETMMGGTIVGPVGFEVLHASEPAVAIVDYARRYPIALLAMTSHSRTNLSRLFHGSEAMRVVHDATCPVLVTRP